MLNNELRYGSGLIITVYEILQDGKTYSISQLTDIVATKTSTIEALELDRLRTRIRNCLHNLKKSNKIEMKEEFTDLKTIKYLCSKKH